MRIWLLGSLNQSSGGITAYSGSPIASHLKTVCLLTEKIFANVAIEYMTSARTSLTQKCQEIVYP